MTTVINDDVAIDWDRDLKKIEGTRFFSRMGVREEAVGNVIFIDSICKAFIHPVEAEFGGCFEAMEWLPTSLGQVDPFYGSVVCSKELTDVRMRLSACLLRVVKDLNVADFACGSHNFKQAAQGGLCYAFRQYAVEKSMGLGTVWGRIADLYYQGHWPLAYARDRIIAV